MRIDTDKAQSFLEQELKTARDNLAEAEGKAHDTLGGDFFYEKKINSLKQRIKTIKRILLLK